MTTAQIIPFPLIENPYDLDQLERRARENGGLTVSEATAALLALRRAWADELETADGERDAEALAEERLGFIRDLEEEVSSLTVEVSDLKNDLELARTALRDAEAHADTLTKQVRAALGHG